MQERLTRVVAYSSVENAGLIIVGYAIGLISPIMFASISRGT